jgi:sugar phosphate permease
MFEDLNNLGLDARQLVITLATVVWLAATLGIAVMRRSVLAAAGVFIAGAFLVWGMANSDFMRDRAGTDLQGLGANVVIVEGP